MHTLSRLTLLFLTLATCCSSPAVPQNDASSASRPASAGPELPAAPAELRDALLRNETAAALALLDGLEREQARFADYWLYLRAQAVAADARESSKRDERKAEAVLLLAGLETRYPASLWLKKARFRRAELLRELGRWAEAEAIYEEEASALRAAARQGELARVYLDFADELRAPPASNAPDPKKPDPTRALPLYRKVLAHGAPPPELERAAFGAALCSQLLEQWPQAVQDWQEYLARCAPIEWMPEELRTRARQPGASGASVPARVAEARLRLAQCRKSAGEPQRARLDYERLVADLGEALAGRGALAEAVQQAAAGVRAELERLRGQAAYEMAETHMGSPASRAARVVADLQRFLALAPAHEKATRAAFEIAERYFAAESYDAECLVALDGFLARAAPAGADAKAREEHANLAMKALFMKGQVHERQKRVGAAREAYLQYVGRHPSGPDWGEAQKRLVYLDHLEALLAREEQAWEKARALFIAFVERHPLDERAVSVLYDLGDLYVRQAQERIERDPAGESKGPSAKRAELLRSAITEWQKPISKEPKSDYASRALYQTGWILENELLELPAAIEAYRRCDFGDKAGEARGRLALMTQPLLELSTERAWHSDEKPRIHLLLRNIETIEVAVYKLDLETYFRKHRQRGGIEELDLDLIAPDQKASVPVSGYADFKPIALDHELAVTGPGVWAVAVASKDRRAATLLIQSDLDVLVQSSRHELLVFAQDSRLQEAAAGVELLVSFPPMAKDGIASLRTLKTGSDGVARLRASELPESGSPAAFPAAGIAVYAKRGAHVTCQGLDLSGLATVAPLTARGAVYTDRTAYQPGERVHWRAILRDVADGRLTFKAGELVSFESNDANGKTLLRRKLPLSAFGTANGELELDRDAPLGRYLLSCQLASGVVIGGEFEVQRYQLRKAELTIEFERPYYFAGELVEARLEARWYWGEPIAASPVSYQLPDGRTGELKTDAEGRARVQFKVPDDARDELVFQATLTEEQVGTSGRVLVATQGFAASLDVPDRPVQAGERFQIVLRTSAPDDTPVAQAMQLKLLRREERPGKSWGEVLVSEHALVTDAKGEARLALALDKGASYVALAEGDDRRGNRVGVRASFLVVGEEDQQKLRFFSQLASLPAGQEASVELVNRASAGLVFLTFQGRDSLAYRVERVAVGKGTIAFPVEDAHAPNLTLNAARMEPGKLHTASIGFQVERTLVVEVAPAAPRAKPGEPAEISLRVTDQLGRPVQAEFSLAVVDAALYDLYPDRFTLARLFRLDEQAPGPLRSEASSTFAYRAQTRAIAAAVLAEEERRADLESWEGARGETMDKLKALGYATGQDRDDAGYKVAGDTAVADEKSERSSDVALGRAGQGSRKGRPGVSPKRELSSLAQASSAGEPQGPEGVQADTAYWNASIVTDAQGRANLSFALPERSTRWRIVCRGVDAGTLAGEAESSLVAQADLFLELRAPAALVEGDRAGVLVRVHNQSGLAGKASLRLRARCGEREQSLPAEITIPAQGSPEQLFELPVELLQPGTLALEATLEAELAGVKYADREQRDVPVELYGLEYTVAKGGVLTGDKSFKLELPSGRTYEQTALELYLGPGLDEMLLAIALGEGAAPVRNWKPGPPRGPAEQAADLLAACALLELSSRAGRAQAPELARLRERAQALVESLSRAQQKNGAWGWMGRAGESEEECSGFVLVALGAARELGLALDGAVVSGGLAALQRGLKAREGENELRALLLFAGASLASGDFALANRLHRERDQLSNAALAFTTLALVRMQRDSMAAEVAAVLEARSPLPTSPAEPVCKWSGDGNSAWNRSDLETSAWALLALARALPRSTRIAPAREHLQANLSWAPARTRSLCAAALAASESAPREALTDCSVELRAAGRSVSLKIAPGTGLGQGRSAIVELPDWKERELLVELRLTGRGAPHYSARLRGFSKDTSPVWIKGLKIRSHQYMAASPVYRGRPVATGFHVLNEEKDTWINKARYVGYGREVFGHIEWFGAGPQRDSGYLMLEIPLPAGTSVLDGSLHGNFKSAEVRPGAILLQLGQNPGFGSVQYRLLGALPGDYRAPPARLYSLYEPGEWASSAPAELAVLARDATNPDPYKPTPAELYELGVAMYDAGDHAPAWENLKALCDGWQAQLRDNYAREAARRLLFLAIERGGASDIVRFFELLKDKDEDFLVPFEQVYAVGRAYRDMEEHERALLIFRATIEETFGLDLKLAGTLEEHGDFARASDTWQRFWREYPDAPAVLQSWLALADKLLAKAPQAAGDASLKKAGRDRAALTVEAVLLLQRFLSLYPDDPLAPEAGLGLVSAQLALSNEVGAAALAGTLAEVYQEPRFADAFRYSRAVAQWSLGKDKEAVQLLEAVSAAQYPDGSGGTRPSPNRDLALYLLAQIQHAAQQAAEAQRYYERVQGTIAGARAALASLREKLLTLDEVTTAAIGKRAVLALRSKNVAQADVLVYPVDLMTLCLREKNLSGIREVNLAGISPVLETKVALSTGLDLRPVTRQVELALDKPGAYLVICRGGELHASGLVLVSDLALEVREDVAGSLALQAIDQPSGKWCKGVELRVIGSDNAEFQSGQTDARGMYEARGLRGQATVIALRTGGQYAFYRGQTPLGLTTKMKIQTQAQQPEDENSGYWLQNVQQLNSDFQTERGKNLLEELLRERKGVQVKQVK